MSLGLTYGTVVIVPYREVWQTLFDLEREAIRRQLGPLTLDIQHVGSTAVPELAAKPILDIAVAIESMAMIRNVADCLTAGGYIDRGKTDNGDYLLVKESEPAVRTVHIHIVEFVSREWRNYIRFRDMLRHDERIRQAYVELKHRLASCYSNDRKLYTAGKDDFITRVLNGQKQ